MIIFTDTYLLLQEVVGPVSYLPAPSNLTALQMASTYYLTRVANAVNLHEYFMTDV